MIKPSQRRQKRAPATTDLNLHTQMAGARSWHWRLIGASAVATGVSVVVWLLGISLLWHLLLVTVSFLVGLAYPVRGSAPWALSWIANKAGLSYQTALELNPEPTEDGYGFSQAIQERALKTTRGLELPENPRWWLPLTALAFGLALLPFTPFRDANRFTAIELPPALQGAGVNTDAAPEAEEPTTAPPDQEQLAETPEVPETARADQEAPSVLDEFDDSNAEAPPEGVGGQSEEEALSRFTESLSEREPPEQTNPFNSVPPENEPATSNEPREGDPNTQSPTDGDREQAQEDQQEGEPQAGEQEGEQSEGVQDQTQGGEEETPSAEAQAEGEQQGEQESQGAEDASATEATEQGAESQDQNALDEGGNDAAGQNASAAAAEPATDLSQQEQAEPEFVEGRLGEGPSTVGGTVRLPGSAGEGAAVTGSPGSFNQAEEQAITEGRIPVEYQDIVRNYFR